MSARLTSALMIDLCASVLATALAVMAGGMGQMGALIASWMFPLVLAAGLSAFAAVWFGSSWAGAISGLAGLPLLLMLGGAIGDAGIVFLSALLSVLMSSAGLLALGVVLLALSVVMSGYALRGRFDGVRPRG